jgi:hypothetical protein
MLSRRGLLFGAAAVAAPAIIRPGLLMPINRMLLPDGMALGSMEHPVATAWWDNLVLDLSEATLEKLIGEIKPPYRGLTLRPRFIHT